MKITFHGATQTVTGSKHLISLKNGYNLLLDCGMYQGLGKETILLNSTLGFHPSEIHEVILSHAHIDHTGLLPKLVKNGFNGKIRGSAATLDLTEILLKDSACIQEADAKFVNKKRFQQGRPLIEPLYTLEDVNATTALFEALPVGKPVRLHQDVEITLYDIGHIFGATAIYLTVKEAGKTIRLAFTGDVGRYSDPLLKPPAPLPQADYLIIESTYGDRLHEQAEDLPERLREIILETCRDKQGKLIIPAFSVGRTQELLFALNELDLDDRLPEVPYYVDSPLSIEATERVKRHPECFNRAVQKILKYDKDPFYFKGLHYIEDKRASQALNNTDTPCVIISASGMAEAGRAKHHIANSISDPKNTILIVGYCEKQSLGARLKEHPDTVSIFGDIYPVRATVESIESMSAHADYRDLCQYLATQDPSEVKRLFIVHGEPEAQSAFREKLLKKGFSDVVIPQLHETFSLN